MMRRNFSNSQILDKKQRVVSLPLHFLNSYHVVFAVINNINEEQLFRRKVLTLHCSTIGGRHKEVALDKMGLNASLVRCHFFSLCNNVKNEVKHE